MNEIRTENNWLNNLHNLIHKAYSNGDLIQLEEIVEGISGLIEESKAYQKRNRGRRIRSTMYERKKYFSFISEIHDLQYRIRLKEERR